MSAPHVAIVCTQHRVDDTRMFSRWTRGLAGRGWRVTHIAPRTGFVPDFPPGAEHVPVDLCESYVERLRRLDRVLPALERARPDLILFPDPELLLLLPRYGRRHGIPVVFDRHENFEEPGSLVQHGGVSSLVARAYRHYERWIAPRLDGVIVVLEEMIENLHPRTVTRVAHNYPTRETVEALGRAPDAGTRRYTCVNVGAVHVERGLYQQLDVARAMVRERGRDDFTLCFGGHFPAGALERSREFVHEHDLQANVHLVESYLPHEEVLELFRAARIGFSPYLDNRTAQITLQNKVLEFMGAGLPVITSPSSANGRVIAQSGGGALFWADQTDAICDQIEAWMDDPEEAKRIGARGRTYLLENLVWEVDLERIDAWLRELVRGRRARAA